MGFENLIVLAVMFGFLAVLLVPAFLVLRGERFWAPWVMIGGGALLLLSLAGNLLGQFYWRRLILNMGGRMSAGGSETEFSLMFERLQFLSLVCAFLMCLSIVIYAFGFLGVAERWKAVFSRAQGLEKATAELSAQRESGGQVASKNPAVRD